MLLSQSSVSALVLMLGCSPVVAWTPGAAHAQHRGRPCARARVRLQGDPSQLGDDDYIPPESPLDALVAREVAAAFDGEESILLDADEETKQQLIESRVGDVTRAVLGK
eukprot:5667769-Prymnesium_polylepis.1